MLPRTAPAWLDRLVTWLEPFETCFGHMAQRGAFRRYLLGLLSDSPRKSMSAMLARIHDPGSYQAFQHFITHAPWDVAPVWRRLLTRLPDRRGVLIIDDTGFPKQGTHSVGVQRQYSGTLGKIGNCQIGVTAALWTGVRAWLLGAELYLPQPWLTRERRQQAGIPPRVRFQEKWRLALTLVDRVRRAGIEVTLVAADAGYGDILEFRTGLDHRTLAYVLGVSGKFAVWIGQPPARLGPSTRAVTAASIGATQVATWATSQPMRAWRRVTWRNGPRRAWHARFLAVRITPVVLWRQHHPLQTLWLLCERPIGRSIGSMKWYISNLPPTTTLRVLVRAAHHRWAIEQQYQQLKEELGFDHFEGRSLPGWQRHVVLTALAYTWLQQERRRGLPRAPTLPVVRAVIQEILTAHFLITTPGYIERMLKLREIQLRI
ncbi:MAG TPA: IS701 family transposase [Gemmatimonadales bacterium]|nr:IS701 family transposase [Gemmatimonadales bacterium]